MINKKINGVTFKQKKEHRREFVELFRKLCYRHSDWQVWQDFICLTATALSQPFNFRKDREDRYLRIIKGYEKSEQEIFPQMLAEIVMAFQQEGFADILGELYMELQLYNKWRGQFFTPYNLCLMMSKMVSGNPIEKIEKNGYITVNEPCCGSGAMLIAFAHSCFDAKVNYQQSVLFAAQDVDPVVARMAFISMALYGMAGYVIVGNTLLHSPDKPLPDDYDVWYTPMYFNNIWRGRRMMSEIRKIEEVG